MNGLLDTGSVYRTVLNTVWYLLDGGELTSDARQELATSLLARRNPQRGYSFSPEAATLAAGVRLPTGEKPRTQLALLNGVELETLRLLLRLCPDSGEVQALCDLAEHRLSGTCYGRICAKGECAYASLSVLRYHLERGGPASAALLARGLTMLRQDRTEEGCYSGVPFYYALLWLTEVAQGPDNDLAHGAREELVYVHDRCVTLRARAGHGDHVWAPVRRRLLEQVAMPGNLGWTPCAARTRRARD